MTTGESRGGASPLGIIGGSAFLKAGEISEATLREIETPFGPVSVHVGPDFAFLRRHGEGGPYRPPHRIPHKAHVLAFEALGVARVTAFTSVGSLRDELGPGTVVVPDDYLSFHPPPTFAEDDYLHVVPALDEGARSLLLRAAEAAVRRRAAAGRPEPPFLRGGVYAETRGPRFETMAEVRMMAPHAHVIGMTAASEATLCQERGVGYAVLSIVDNWANGLGTTPLTLEGFQAQLVHGAELAREILTELLAAWRAG